MKVFVFRNWLKSQHLTNSCLRRQEKENRKQKYSYKLKKFYCSRTKVEIIFARSIWSKCKIQQYYLCQTEPVFSCRNLHTVIIQATALARVKTMIHFNHMFKKKFLCYYWFAKRIFWSIATRAYDLFYFISFLVLVLHFHYWQSKRELTTLTIKYWRINFMIAVSISVSLSDMRDIGHQMDWIFPLRVQWIKPVNISDIYIHYKKIRSLPIE